MALDIGTKKTGVAISDSELVVVFPREEIHHSTPDELVRIIKKIEASENIVEVLVGIPVSMSGQATEQTTFTNKVIDLLKTSLKVPIVKIDERMTTREAKQKVKTKMPVDSLSAAIMLENYLRIKA